MSGYLHRQSSSTAQRAADKGKGKEIPPQDALARQRPRPYLRLIIMETVTTETKRDENNVEESQLLTRPPIRDSFDYEPRTRYSVLTGVRLSSSRS